MKVRGMLNTVVPELKAKLYALGMAKLFVLERKSSTRACTRIDVVIQRGDVKKKQPPFISISNDSMGIPVTMQKTEKLYVPELLFGQLLTSSNFDDDNEEEHDGLTGGRHGYGAKLTQLYPYSHQGRLDQGPGDDDEAANNGDKKKPTKWAISDIPT